MRRKRYWRRILAGAFTLVGVGLITAGLLDAAEWKVEVVDQSGSGRFTSLKIDTSGNAHLAYVPDIDGHPLKYAFWDHKLDRWFTMTIAINASFCTLVLDSQQRPHISFADQGTGKGSRIQYARWDGATWKIDAVSPRSEAVVGYYTSIALNAEDKPVFSYYDYIGPDGGQTLRLRSVFWGGNYWGVQIVDPVPGSGKFNSIAIDSKGHPHIAYANVKAETMSLRYATLNGDSWTTEILEGIQGPTGIFSVSMVMDKADNPHIAYTDVARRLVKYATRENGQWHLYDVDVIKGVGLPDRNGIALDSEGRPYISYFDTGAGVLKVTSRKGDKWYAETIATDFAGFTSSLQIHDDTLWVAFADDNNGAVKVARRRLEGRAASSTQSRPAASKVINAK
jgi:hypothetical protein